MRKGKIVIVLVGLLVVAGILLRVAGRTSASGASSRGGAQGPITVETVMVSLRPLGDRAVFTGTVNASYQYVVSAKVAGRLSRLERRIGDRVRGDEIVGSIDDTEYRQAVQEAEAQLQVSDAALSEARAQAGLTSRELQRMHELVQKGISSQAELDVLQTRFAAQESRVELAVAQRAQRESQRAQARTRLGYTVLRAARPGLVAARHIDGGAQLAVGTPVLSVVGIDTVYVEVAVPEREYGRITVGQNVTVRVDAVAGRAFDGTVRHAAPYFDAVTRSARIEIAVVNDALLLKPGMSATATITFRHIDSARVLPAAAIVRLGGETAVYVVESDTARLQTVQTGLSEDDWIEVLSPLLTAPVVTLGNHLLRDGAPVRVGTLSARGAGASRPER